jgi:hypothetical protein
MPSPFTYMGQPLSPSTVMGCTDTHTLHYDYYPTYIGLQSLGVTEPMFIHRRCTTLHYVFMHIPPSSFMGTCPPSPSTYMGRGFVCVSPPLLLPLIGGKGGGALPRPCRNATRHFKGAAGSHDPTFVPTDPQCSVGVRRHPGGGLPTLGQPVR